jgi:hypothetical protein
VNSFSMVIALGLATGLAVVPREHLRPLLAVSKETLPGQNAILRPHARLAGDGERLPRALGSAGHAGDET